MKTPGPTKAEPSAPNSANSTGQTKFTPRQSRLLRALLDTHGWIPRESVDRITGASNGPQIVREVRAKVTGREGIETQHVESTDRDGKACKPGQYRLTAVGRERALKVFEKDAGAA
jgi:hypothetical protein